MNAKLVHEATGLELRPGQMIRPAMGGAPWRYHGITELPCHVHGGQIMCSRSMGTGRVHRTFSPHLFGCTLVVDVRLYRDTERIKHGLTWFMGQTSMLVLGGIIAWFVAHLMGA